MKFVLKNINGQFYGGLVQSENGTVPKLVDAENATVFTLNTDFGLISVKPDIPGEVRNYFKPVSLRVEG